MDEVKELRPIPKEYEGFSGTGKPYYYEINDFYCDPQKTISVNDPRVSAFNAAMRKATGYDFEDTWSPGYNGTLAISMGVMTPEQVMALAMLLS